MKRRNFLAASALLAAPTPAFAPTAAFAHGTPPAPIHGGVVREDNAEHWIELVVRGDQLVAYVSDADNKPLPAAQLAGKAVVLAGGKTETVTLIAAAGNSLAASLSAAVSGKVTVVLQMTIAGTPATVRIAVG